MVHLDGRAYSEDDIESVDAVGEGAEFSESGDSGEDVIGVTCMSMWGVRGVVVCLVVWLCVPSGAVMDGSRQDSLTVREVQWGDGRDRRVGLGQQAATVDDTIL
jgi:hypothetical protein